MVVEDGGVLLESLGDGGSFRVDLGKFESFGTVQDVSVDILFQISDGFEGLLVETQ